MALASMGAALVDLKACFIGNPVAVSEGRCSRMVVWGYVIDGRKWKRVRGKTVSETVGLVVLLVGDVGGSSGDGDGIAV